MTDIAFPPGLAPRRITWTLERAVASFDSPLSFATQRVARSGARWRASVEMPPLESTDTGLLNAWLDQISRADNCGLLPVFQNDKGATDSSRAEFASQQVSWHLSGALTGWTAFNLLQAPVLADRNILLSAGAATGPSAQARYERSFTVVAGLPYSVIVDVPDQFSPGGLVVTNGAGTSTYFDSRSAPTTGRIVVTATSNDTGLLVGLYAGNGQTNFITSMWGLVQVARNYIVQSAATAGVRTVTLSGSDFVTAGNPARITNLMRTLRNGQFVSLRSASGALELKRVQAEVITTGGGSIGGVSVGHLGRLQFEPALRNALAVNDRILTDQPWCRMRLAEPNSSATIDAPLFGGFTFDLVEWFGA